MHLRLKVSFLLTAANYQSKWFCVFHFVALLFVTDKAEFFGQVWSNFEKNRFILLCWDDTYIFSQSLISGLNFSASVSVYFEFHVTKSSATYVRKWDRFETCISFHWSSTHPEGNNLRPLFLHCLLVRKDMPLVPRSSNLNTISLFAQTQKCSH